ncbi:MAG TPA: hypothetical protein VG713_07810 [Pirellulales bacterium]|nr:hypothetical protein [Pirellulales bacterium]
MSKQQKLAGLRSSRTLASRWVILGMAVLAVAAISVSQLYYQRLQRQSIAFWGTEAANTIVNSPRVIALRLGKPGEMSTAGTIETIHAGGVSRSVLERKIVVGAPGLSHLRASLVNDTSYDWDAKTGDCEPDWKYALEFGSGEVSSIVLLFAPNCGLVRLAHAGKSAHLRTMDAVEKFMNEQFWAP